MFRLKIEFSKMPLDNIINSSYPDTLTINKTRSISLVESGLKF